MPEELWTEVCNTINEAVTKITPKNKRNKAKLLSDQALQIAKRRREAKAKEKRKDKPI